MLDTSDDASACPRVAIISVMYYTYWVSIKIKGRVGHNMDFRNRGVGSPSSITTPTSSSSAAGNALSKPGLAKWLERGSVVLLFSIAILIAGIAALTFFGGNSQARIINEKQYQAVFLNNGQVYFGNIKELNNKYFNLTNVYYLQTNNSDGAQAAASTNVTLVKLGCELHAPADQMLINSDQVLFWENLKDSGEVAKKIAEHKKTNPKGQACTAAPTGSTQQAAPNTSTQAAPTPPTQAPAPSRRP